MDGKWNSSTDSNCTLTQEAIQSIHIVASVTGIVCFLLVLPVLLLELFHYKAYKNTLQRMAVYLTVIVALLEALISGNIVYYHYGARNSLCKVITILPNCMSASFRIMAIEITLYLLIYIYHKLRGASAGRISRSRFRYLNKALEITCLLIAILLPLAYVWSPVVHDDHCDFKIPNDDDCTLQISKEYVRSLYLDLAFVFMTGLAGVILFPIYCYMNYKHRGTPSQKVKSLITRTIFFMIFCGVVVIIVTILSFLLPRALKNDPFLLSNIRFATAPWIDPIFVVGFLVYLHSIKTLGKRQAGTTTTTCCPHWCCQNKRRESVLENTDINQTRPSSHPALVQSTTNFPIEYTGEFTQITSSRQECLPFVGDEAREQYGCIN